MKKVSTWLGLSLAGVLAGCGAINTPTTSQAPAPTLNPALTETYAQTALAGISLLAAQGGVDSNPVTAGPTKLAVKAAPTLVTEEDLIAQFTQYIHLMDSFLTEDGQPFTIVNYVSDRPEYAYQVAVTIKDLANNTMVFMMYFNLDESVIDDGTSSETDSSEVITSSDATATTEDLSSLSESSVEDVTSSDPTSNNPEVQGRRDHDDDHEDEEDEEDDEDEENEFEYDDDEDLYDRSEEASYRDHHDRDLEDDEDVLLEGVVIYEGNEYQLIGFQEVEADEVETKYFISLDESNWIKIKHEVEADEQSYAMSMKKDGSFSRLSFKIELEDDGYVIKLKSLINNQLVTYRFKQDVVDGQDIIRIMVLENRQVLQILAIPFVDDITGETGYTFYSLQSGKTYEGRPGHGHGGRDRD
jgi:hypothetical protein